MNFEDIKDDARAFDPTRNLYATLGVQPGSKRLGREYFYVRYDGEEFCLVAWRTATGRWQAWEREGRPTDQKGFEAWMRGLMVTQRRPASPSSVPPGAGGAKS